MTLLLKLFLFHILYACDNKITLFSSVYVNSQNLKIFNLNCTVLLTLGVMSTDNKTDIALYVTLSKQSHSLTKQRMFKQLASTQM